jgi:hypothetical protein
VDDKNYLIPISANVETKTDIKYHLVDANFILDEMTFAGTKVNVIILDACRNNPFGGRGFRGTSTGLAQMSAPRGTIIAYSTAPGRVAADGQGDNSPYSSVLAEAIIQPGLRIEDVFIRVNQGVDKTTGGEQEPWQANNLRGVFYFNGPTTVVVAPEIKPGPSRDNEALFWQSIMNENNPAAYEEYLRKYPNGEFATLARMKIDGLKSKEPRSASPEPSKPQQQATVPPLFQSSPLFSGKTLPQDKVQATKPADPVAVKTEPRGINKWFVVLGSFPKANRTGAENILGRARRSGLQAAIVDTDNYPNFTGGLWAVVVGPFASKELADNSKNAAKGLIPDAYVKAGWK